MNCGVVGRVGPTSKLRNVHNPGFLLCQWLCTLSVTGMIAQIFILSIQSLFARFQVIECGVCVKSPFDFEGAFWTYRLLTSVKGQGLFSCLLF